MKATDQWPAYVEEVARLAGVPAAEVDRQTRLIADLEMDSLAIVELVIKLDHDHGIDTAGRLRAEGWNQITAGELFDRALES